MNRFFIFFIFFVICACYDFLNLKFGKYYDFYSIPVLHDGRIKPLGTLIEYDYKTVLHINGEKNINSLAKLFFNSKLFFLNKKINISDHNIKNNFGLTDKNFFTIFELLDSFKKNTELINNLLSASEKSLNESQKNILSIYSDILLILDLSKCMDLVALNDKIIEKSNGLLKNKYEFILNFNEINESVFNAGNLEFNFLITKNNNWGNLNDFFSINEIRESLEIKLLNEISNHFFENDMDMWSKKCEEFKNVIFSKLTKFNVFLIKLEVFYNCSKFILNSCFCFLICLFLILFSNKMLFVKLSKVMFCFGLLMVFFDIIFRIILTQKSPVTSLQESLIFVNFVFTSFFLIFLFKYNHSKYFLISAITSFLLSFISIRLGEGNNIKSVVAVLNTNFWLIIHVLTISIGYGFCLIGGFLSHFYLYRNFKKKYLSGKNNLYIYIFYITLLALFFSFVGTLLGGIWADQSWGRFWGWDPKENGALLIVLWLTLILHAKSSNLISELYFVIGVILNLVILALAWFGVNLLSVGLHSYGFIENIGIGLAIYIAFEIFIILYFFVLFKKNSASLH